MTVSEIDLILRILDPDQSGHVEMEEWLDFMLATENDLEKHTRNTEHKINAINGEKSLMHDVSAAASSLKDQTVGTVTGAVAGTVGAMGAVAGAVGVELPEVRTAPLHGWRTCAEALRVCRACRALHPRPDNKPLHRPLRQDQGRRLRTRRRTVVRTPQRATRRPRRR